MSSRIAAVLRARDLEERTARARQERAARPVPRFEQRLYELGAPVALNAAEFGDATIIETEDLGGGRKRHVAERDGRLVQILERPAEEGES
jgi:hypothetical protein